ncbi:MULTISPECIES: HAMP domain-containing sensor histidine kinase [Gammaproteobacteria]|uniref:histidine kinase n=1 Tax=Vreelandella halophila TaxID=86177 RepID=A0A9X4YA61_9GAMM|nr:HAMP domain-containing sensor histidine kinase [Halospina sp. K52047b]KAA8982823.1 HAMP domain-containing histidine kinase [Halospina sp. K52047b]MYL26012.1 HAMP domain-containing protein [Halomonas utahensis]MYL73426.1 HAMP domain-containing protein [Halomonas sp. 22501_18_FS]
MTILSQLRTSTFQVAMLYMVVFATSVFILLAFIYWRTAGFMMEQTDQTIEAEIAGLAEQYRSRGINGLMNVVRERVARDPDGQSLYLFATEDYLKLAGNLPKWPESARTDNGWIDFTLDESMGYEDEERRARARVFEVQGGLRLLVGQDISELTRVKSLIETAMNWGMGISLGLALIGGFLMSRSTTRRIEVINQTAYRIMHGDLSQRVPTRGTQDDFDQLADNLNQMLDRIEYLMEGIRHVSDSIAHDLRTPLTRLRSQLENTLINLKDPDVQDQVGEAVAEADQLLGTFNALLRIARLETGGKTLQSEPLELGTLVTDAVELYEALAEEKDQVLDYEVGEEVSLLGDRDLLFQAVSNLIDNAIKYTDEGGRIGVAVRREGGQAVLEVADSGDGVPDHEKENIFGRFYRVGKSRSQPGNGLGLSLVSAVVELHEGHIGLSDAEPGAERPGLKVTLYLPAQPPSGDSGEREQ